MHYRSSGVIRGIEFYSEDQKMTASKIWIEYFNLRLKIRPFPDSKQTVCLPVKSNRSGTAEWIHQKYNEYGKKILIDRINKVKWI